MLTYLRKLFTFVKLILLKFSDGAKNKLREVAAYSYTFAKCLLLHKVSSFSFL